MNSGPGLAPGDLPSTVVNHSLERKLGGEASPASPSSGAEFLTSFDGQGVLPLAEVERRAILTAMEYTKGDRTLAAAMLGIGRTTLYRKLKEYGL